jgi:hypothetical protein
MAFDSAIDGRAVVAAPKAVALNVNVANSLGPVAFNMIFPLFSIVQMPSSAARS